MKKILIVLFIMVVNLPNISFAQNDVYNGWYIYKPSSIRSDTIRGYMQFTRDSFKTYYVVKYKMQIAKHTTRIRTQNNDGFTDLEGSKTIVERGYWATDVHASKLLAKKYSSKTDEVISLSFDNEEKAKGAFDDMGMGFLFFLTRARIIDTIDVRSSIAFVPDINNEHLIDLRN